MSTKFTVLKENWQNEWVTDFLQKTKKLKNYCEFQREKNQVEIRMFETVCSGWWMLCYEWDGSYTFLRK